VKKLNKTETLILLKFARLFSNKLNVLNLTMQNDFFQFTKLHKKIREIFNNYANHLLKEEYRQLDVETKLTLFKRNANLDVVTIEEGYARSDIEFDANIEYLYQSEVNLKEIDEKNRGEIISNLRGYITRACWKMIDVFPYKDDLLLDVSCIYPKSFSYQKWEKVTKRFERVLSKKFFVFLEELENTKKNCHSLSKSTRTLLIPKLQIKRMMIVL